MTWRVIMQPEAKLELKHEVEAYGERLLDEVDAVREWLRKMPLRYQQWPTVPAYRRAVVNDFPFVVFYRIDEARRTVVIVALAPTSKEPGYWIAR